MRLLLLCTVLQLHSQGFTAQSCPAGCMCQEGNEVFCLAQKSALIPKGIPEDTKALYLFEVGITTLLEEDFLRLTKLQLLDLSQNKISDLKNNIFQPLTSLQNLDLSSNQITEITNETFHGLLLLERLYLHNNNIQHIHRSAFNTLERLLELKLQYNQLHAIPPLRLPSLLLLDISGNKIPFLQPETFLTINIESLKIAGLGISTLDKELFENLKNLHELDLSDNHLEKVPAVLAKLSTLTKLNLSGNAQISQLQAEDFHNLHALQDLDISNMNIKTIPKDFFHLFPKLQALTAAGNPFNCVCQLSWFVEWVRSSGVVLKRSEETRCHFPPICAGKLLQSLKHSDFGCPTTTTSPTTTISTTAQMPALPMTSSQQPPVDHVTPPATPRSVPKERAFTTMSVINHNMKTSPKVSICPDNICLHGGTCHLDRYGQLECMCAIGFFGPYCERKVQVTVAPTTTEQLGYIPQIHLKRITGTSVTVDLNSYVHSRSQLKGVRLTYRNLSGSDNRPMLLSLPASLAEYTVRALIPNSTYQICLGPLGEKDSKEEACGVAQTTQSSPQYHAKIQQADESSLALILVPSLAAGLLVVVAAAAGTWYFRNRRAKGHLETEMSPNPLELKTCLDNGELPNPSPNSSEKTASIGTLECEMLLMQQSCPSNNNCPVLKPSYF